MPDAKAFVPKVTKQAVEASTKQKKLVEGGFYRFRVSRSKPDISKNTGSFMIVDSVAPLDPAGNPKMPFTNIYHTLPLPKDKDAMLAFGISEEKAARILKDNAIPGTIQMYRKYVRVTKGKEQFVDYPKREQFGTEQEYEEVKQTINQVVLEYAAAAYSNPDLHKGNEFIGKVKYQTDEETGEKSNFASIEFYHELPSDAVLLDPTTAFVVG